MTDSDKLNSVLDELINVYHLNGEYINLIRDNIVLRCNYYKKIHLNFDNETIYINNSSTIMDFFLNRLLHNIRGYEYNNVYNLNNAEEEDYDIDTQKLKLSSLKAVSDVSINKLKNRLPDIDEDTARQINKKIICHEFGHVFQTAFSGIIGNNDSKDKHSHLKTGVIVGVVMGYHATIYMIYNNLSINIMDLIKYLPVSLCYIASMVIGYRGLKYLELSISSPIQNTSGVIVALLLIIFLKYSHEK